MRKTEQAIILTDIANSNSKHETLYSIRAKINDVRFLYDNGSITRYDYRRISKQLNETIKQITKLIGN